MEAQAPELLSQGGKITITGYRIEQAGQILAQGKENQTGGNISLISKDYTLLAENSLTAANNPTQHGSAGTVFIWSDRETLFDRGAKIDISAGRLSGNGGFTEVSGKETVWVRGQFDGSAPNGIGGSVLIDPTDINIANGGAYDPQAGQTFNGMSNISLLATNNITVSSAFTANTASGLSNTSITLSAGNDILINANLTTNNANLVLIADNDSDNNGGISINTGHCIRRWG